MNFRFVCGHYFFSTGFFFFFFLNCCLAASRPTLGHSQGNSLTNLMLITVFYLCWPKGHQEPRNETLRVWNTCFKEWNTMVVGKALRITIIFHKKQCLPLITRKKKHSLKQTVSVPCTLEKKVFAAATFEGLWVLSIWR